MNDLPKTIIWAGQHFSLRPLAKERSAPTELAWAIWRGREFIGTIPYIPEETTQEFELRSRTWVSDLVGGG